MSPPSAWLLYPDLTGGVVTTNGSRVDANGGLLWSVSTLSVGDPASCRDGKGGYIQAGTSGNDLFATRVTVTGAKPWGGANGYVLISGAAGSQSLSAIASDGSGGAVIAWLDTRNSGFYDVYAARVDSSGNLLWLSTGVPVCVVAGDQNDLAVTGDGSGGAYIAWRDLRAGAVGGSDIYAQHLNASGVPQWAADGMPLCNAAGAQQASVLETDGAGGIFAAWWDLRDGPIHIYMQRLDSAGAPVLPPNGQLAVGGTVGALLPQLVADGSNGVFMAWEDHRPANGATTDIYANRFNGAGVSMWGGEVPVCTESTMQLRPSMIGDGAGGAIISWVDNRNLLGSTGYPQYLPYSQRLNSAGVALWAHDGVPVGLDVSSGASSNVPLASDGLGGAYYRSGIPQKLFRLFADGSPAWVPNFAPTGLAAADLPGDEGGYVRLAFTAAQADLKPLSPLPNLYEVWRRIPGSALSRTGAPSNSRLARLPAATLAAGTTLPAGNWEIVSTLVANGAPNYTAAVPTHADSGAAGFANETYVVMTMTATRSIYTFSDAVTAHSVDNLPPGVPSLLVGGRTGSSSVQLAWQPSAAADLWHYSVYRGSSAGFAADAAHRIAVPTAANYLDGAFVDGAYYKVTATDRHGNESPAAQLAPANITGVAPDIAPRVSYATVVGANPFTRRAVIEYGLAQAGRVDLAIYDLAGRRVASLVDGERAAGVQRVTWDGAGASSSRLEPGVYLARFEAPGVTRTLRLVRVE